MRSVSAKKNPLEALKDLAAQERKQTAMTLVYMAEFDRRRLYESFGYTTMLDYCVRHLHMDDDEVEEQIEVARVALVYPVLFEAIADGRLHTAAVRLIAPHLTAENVDELIAAMTRRQEGEIKAMLKEWFPEPTA
jgi:hypothetical protein